MRWGSRFLLPLAVVLVVGTSAAWAVTGAATVKTAKNTALGSIVVNARGLTLYHLTSEKGGKIKCTGGCATEWPPLLVAGTAKPVAGAGIAAAELGTVKRPDGTRQVTYAGSPLYLYGDDKKAGQAKGEAEGGVWFAVAPTGAVVKPATAASTAAPAANSPTPMDPGAGYGGSNGSGY